jgi:hypothetical protein
MASVSLVSAQVLPRFLLPKLSWQAGMQKVPLRTLSTIAASQTVHSSSYDHRRSHILSYRNTRDYESSQHKSQILRQLPQRRGFRGTARQARDHHFDTLKFVQRLKEEGFTEAQSVAMMKVLSDVIEERCVFLLGIMAKD